MPTLRRETHGRLQHGLVAGGDDLADKRHPLVLVLGQVGAVDAHEDSGVLRTRGQLPALSARRPRALLRRTPSAIVDEFAVLGYGRRARSGGRSRRREIETSRLGAPRVGICQCLLCNPNCEIRCIARSPVRTTALARRAVLFAAGFAAAEDFDAGGLASSACAWQRRALPEGEFRSIGRLLRPPASARRVRARGIAMLGVALGLSALAVANAAGALRPVLSRSCPPNHARNGGPLTRAPPQRPSPGTLRSPRTPPTRPSSSSAAMTRMGTRCVEPHPLRPLPRLLRRVRRF